jgi:alkanesulfonate monooxygenase SsuD/methylene tetrahydromethanopterin reductase-like flavin-dependent oxidoreductase (luciferase family)
VHRIRHDGSPFRIEAIHLCEPWPQRTPVLYQAGASARGRKFPATHAECVFINRPSKQVIPPIVADIRRQAAAADRNPAISSPGAGSNFTYGRCPGTGY